jgi:hypothetical protein
VTARRPAPLLEELQRTEIFEAVERAGLDRRAFDQADGGPSDVARLERRPGGGSSSASVLRHQRPTATVGFARPGAPRP